MPFVRPVVELLKDVAGLASVQSLLLLLSLILTHGDQGDVRLQFAWTVFLLPGWFLASSWTGRHAAFSVRYAHAVVSAVALHGVLVASLAGLGFGFRAYFIAFGAAVILFGIARAHHLNRSPALLRLPRQHVETLTWIAVMVLVVAVFRQPRSADVIQFSLQQQDMELSQSMQPSDIGMTAMGVDQPMPRWRAQHWHLVPSLLSTATGLPVDGILRRWGTIPAAFSSLVVLLTVVRRLTFPRLQLWVVVLAVFAPVLLWYRSYNAFNYSFRLSNNFLLDKDFCLFVLVPATVYLAVRWLSGQRRIAWVLFALMPAIIKFHPMTSVYLVLLTPFVVIGYDRAHGCGGSLLNQGLGGSWRKHVCEYWPSSRAFVWTGTCVALFIAVLIIGDAQTAHEQIAEIVQLDFDAAQTGRPLHYWVGHYAAIQGHELPLDTTAWSEGKLYLRARVLLNCGLLGAMHAAWFVWLLAICIHPASLVVRRWLAISCVLLMLWGMWLMAPAFLTWKPHYLAGFERLHWFAYVPALIALAGSISLAFDWMTVRLASYQPRATKEIMTVVTGLSVVALLLYSSFTFLQRRETVWTSVPYLNSLLDFELADQVDRDARYDFRVASQSLESRRPNVLRQRDRVLFLDTSGNDQFWLIKQGVFWSEPYAEAFALQRRGESFLEDRRHFYALLDRTEVDGVSDWLEKRKVTLIIDRRADGDRYMETLNHDHQLGMERIEPGVWRRVDAIEEEVDSQPLNQPTGEPT